MFSSETPTKPQRNRLALVNPASVGQQVLAVAFLTSVDWSPLSPTPISWLTPSLDCNLNCSLLLTVSSGTFCWPPLGPSFPHPLPVMWEISYTSLFCGFRAKTKRSFDWHPQPPTQRMPNIMSQWRIEDSWSSPRYYSEVTRKQPRPGFELVSLSPKYNVEALKR